MTQSNHCQLKIGSYYRMEAGPVRWQPSWFGQFLKYCRRSPFERWSEFKLVKKTSLCGKQVVLLLLTSKPRIPAVYSSEEVQEVRIYSSSHSVLLLDAERVYPNQIPDKTDSHASPNTGQTRSNAGPDETKTNSDRTKSFSKNLPNASSNHSDLNPIPVDVNCTIFSVHFSVITSKWLLPIIRLQASTNFHNADCLTLCDSATSHSWKSANIINRLILSGRDLYPTVNGIYTTTDVRTKDVQKNVFSNFDGFEYRFESTAFRD